MARLEPPVKRYVLGKLPSHSSTMKLHENYADVGVAKIMSSLTKAGYLTPDGKPTRKAFTDNVAEVCEKNMLWNLDAVTNLLVSDYGSRASRRVYVNQNIPLEPSLDPKFVAMSVIGSYFNASSVKVGKWLNELGLRDEEGLPSKEAQDRALARVETMETRSNAGKKSTRKFGLWNLYEIVTMLHREGHPIDIDYESTLKGKGKNSDVTVQTGIEPRVNEFIKAFVPLYNAGDKECMRLVMKSPTLIKKRAEEKLGKPGLFTKNLYKNRLS